MPLSRRVVIECPKCGYTKIVVRGDCLPDKSMFQKCPKCKTFMIDSDKSVEEVMNKPSNLINELTELIDKIFKK